MLDPGAIFADHFRLLTILGTGAMATVYKAEDLILQRVVALKLLDATLVDSVAMDRFKVEVKASTLLSHPNIAKVYQFGIFNGQPYMSMEFIEGVTLAELLKEEGKLEAGTVQAIFSSILSALQYAHEQGVLHRDIKPGNIMVRREEDLPGRLVPYLLDFGLAKLQVAQSQAQTLTAANIPVGTPLYMSPEQCTGAAIDGRADVYSAACVLYECLSGKPPFSGGTAYETMYEHLTRSVPDFDELSGPIRVPRAVAMVVLRALRKKPQDRQQSAEQFREELEKSFSGSQGVATHPLAKHCKNKTVVLACTVIVLLFAIVGFSFFLSAPESGLEQTAHKVHHGLDVKATRMLLRQASSRFLVIQGSSRNEEQRRKLLNDMLYDVEQGMARDQADLTAEELWQAYYLKGQVYCELSNREKAVQMFKCAAELFPRPGNPGYVFRLRAASGVAQSYSTALMPDKAIEVLNNAIAEYRKNSPSSDELAMTYNTLGDYYTNERRYGQAIKTYNESMGLLERDNLQTITHFSQSCAGLMKCRYMLKDYAAVDAALELGKRWAKEADSERVCRQYCTLAAACKFCNKPRESLKLYRQALSSLEWQLRENSEVKRVLKMDIKNEIAKLERL